MIAAKLSPTATPISKQQASHSPPPAQPSMVAKTGHLLSSVGSTLWSGATGAVSLSFGVLRSSVSAGSSAITGVANGVVGLVNLRSTTGPGSNATANENTSEKCPPVPSVESSAPVQVKSYLPKSLLRGCTCIRTTAYHPAVNGMVEWFHRQLKVSLRATDDPNNWMDRLPLVLFGICSALKSNVDCSTAELMFDATVRLPVSDFTSISDVIKFAGAPFRFVSRRTKTFRIQRGSQDEVVSVDRLKTALPETPSDKPCGPLPCGPPPPPLS
ncbi:unnamed protein product [Schistocephalus solidus]|uniref:Integrase catalytic domain-containing protein n=1 Tax=Schistocephalus solidus TaxID=70667 RepID=A0A3P7CMB3_SCHSO|nr:unnamed protein product [Schistocephalus solidus]